MEGAHPFHRVEMHQYPTGPEASFLPSTCKALGISWGAQTLQESKRHAGLLPALAGTEGEKLIYFHNLQSPGEVDMPRLGTRDGSFLSLAL